MQWVDGEKGKREMERGGGSRGDGERDGWRRGAEEGEGL